MNPFQSSALIAILALGTFAAHAGLVPAVIDDFSDAQRTTTGIERFLIDDKDAGGRSQATQTCTDGILSVNGRLAPGRGMPAFISVPLLLSADAAPGDLSAYEGIRLRVKVTKGILSVQACSSEIDNFDFHTSAPINRTPDGFQEVRIRFTDLKRAWSEQTPLNLKSITSINLVAVGMVPNAFSYEVDEVGFY